MRLDPRKRRTALLALGIAILVGALAGLLGRGHFAGRYAVPVPGSEPHVAVPPPPPRIVAAPPPPVVVMPPAPAPVVDAEDEDEDEDAGRIAAAIARATRKALDRGAPVHWHKAGQSGYIVVSAAQDYPDHVCRNVSATITGDNGETRSGAHLWCLWDGGEDGDGEWRPAP